MCNVCAWALRTVSVEDPRTRLSLSPSLDQRPTWPIHSPMSTTTLINFGQWLRLSISLLEQAESVCSQNGRWYGWADALVDAVCLNNKWVNVVMKMGRTAIQHPLWHSVCQMPFCRQLNSRRFFIHISHSCCLVGQLYVSILQSRQIITQFRLEHSGYVLK